MSSHGKGDAEDPYEAGNDHFVAGRFAEAARAYERAIAGGRSDGDVFENLGLALWQAGRWRAAARALLRALDGRLTAREQTLRVLVSCLFRDGAMLDGERLLLRYEAAFGPHPEGWKRQQ